MELTTCPNCGSPNSTVKRKKNKHKGVIISIIVFALIVVSALGIGISKKAKELEYYSNMEKVSLQIPLFSYSGMLHSGYHNAAVPEYLPDTFS